MLHILSLNLLGSSPDRYARGSAKRLNALIASTTQLGSPRNYTSALDSGLQVYPRLYNDAIIQTSLHGLSYLSALISISCDRDVSTCGRR